jgi:V/A-type H+-transporting ATPase subunit K
MRRFALPLLLIAGAAALAAFGTALLAFPETASAQAAARTALPPDAWTWGLVSAALATAASSIAGGYAVAKLGAAAVGALAEKPDLFGRLLIFVGLAEGIAIYGVIISILILNRLA